MRGWKEGGWFPQPIDREHGFFHKDIEELRELYVSGSCYCAIAWAINQRKYWGLMGWHCPEHGAVIPDEEGNPLPKHVLKERELQRRKAERLEKQKPKEWKKRWVDNWLQPPLEVGATGGRR